MHSAPTVTYPVGSWSLRPLYLFALAAGGLAALTFCLQQPDALTAPTMWLSMTWLVSLAATVWASRRDHSGSLKWSEGKWTWSSQTYACSGTLTVLVDVQQVLVVIMKVDDGGVLWFWLRRVADPSAWPALRRAMVSTSGRHALPADRATDGAPL